MLLVHFVRVHLQLDNSMNDEKVISIAKKVFNEYNRYIRCNVHCKENDHNGLTG